MKMLVNINNTSTSRGVCSDNILIWLLTLNLIVSNLVSAMRMLIGS